MATPTPTPSKHPKVILTVGMSISLSLLGYLLYKTYFRPEPPTPPICSGAQQIRLGVGDRLVGTALSMECTTNWIRIPYGSWANIDTGMGQNEEIHYQFSDGSTRHVTPKSKPDGTAVPSREFRIWGKGVPTYTITSRD